MRVSVWGFVRSPPGGAGAGAGAGAEADAANVDGAAMREAVRAAPRLERRLVEVGEEIGQGVPEDLPFADGDGVPSRRASAGRSVDATVTAGSLLATGSKEPERWTTMVVTFEMALSVRLSAASVCHVCLQRLSVTSVSETR